MEVAPDYTSRLTDIAKEIGLSAVQVGKMLQAAGLRTPTGYPTAKAIAQGAARSTWDGRERKNEWHIANVLAALQQERRAAR